MIIVKITFLLFLITAISIFFLRCWAKANPIEAVAMSYGIKLPKWCLFFGILIILDALGIVLSAIWFLFF